MSDRTDLNDLHMLVNSIDAELTDMAAARSLRDPAVMQIHTAGVMLRAAAVHLQKAIDASRPVGRPANDAHVAPAQRLGR